MNKKDTIMAYNVKKKKPKNKDVPIIIRVRTPQEGQLLGIVEQLLGERRMRVRCSDGFTRLCRIPGKIRRRIWVKEGGIVLIDPWTVQTNERGDILCLYSIQQENWLRGRGYLNKLDEL